MRKGHDKSRFTVFLFIFIHSVISGTEDSIMV